jgi:predicted amidohydrolase YtcJ
MVAYARTLPKGTWIRNGDWDHTNWGGELPTRAWIDSVTPNNPVDPHREDVAVRLVARLLARSVPPRLAQAVEADACKGCDAQPAGAGP